MVFVAVLCVFMKVEEKCSVLGREKNELQSRIEENDEEVDELMKKYKAAIQQVSVLFRPHRLHAMHRCGLLLEM